MVNAQVIELLRAAKREIERDGWVQGNYEGECGGYCLMGWPYMNAETNALFLGFARALGFDNDAQATQWNDEKGRTQQEVLARLDAAIQAHAC
jgi:hypothetical protein